MKRLFRWIRNAVKKWRFNRKLKDIDRLAAFLGMDSWGLPPSYYYRYTQEELEEIKREMRERLQVYFDEWDREEQEEKLRIERQCINELGNDNNIEEFQTDEENKDS